MAKKVKKEEKAAAFAAAAPVVKKGKKELTPEEKKAKREKMRERLANRPEGQRPNSKQIDVIELEGGSKIMNFGMPVRKQGTLITSVAVNAKGEIVSTSVTMVLGVSPKSKKGHGSLVPKVPGMGKKGKLEDDPEVEEVEDEDDED